MGQVLADVLIKPDGAVVLMRPSPVLRRSWVEGYVARDVVSLFGNPSPPCFSLPMDSSHVVMTNSNYILDLQTVGIKPGLQPVSLFDETKAATK